MRELVESRNELKKLQEGMSAMFALAGKDLDFTKVNEILGEDVSKCNTKAKCEKIEVYNLKMSELGKDIDVFVAAQTAQKALRLRQAEPEPKSPIVQPNGGSSVKSLGRQIVESDWHKEVKANRGELSIKDPTSQLSWGIKELKTLFQTSAGLTPESTRTGLLVEAVTRPLQILDLIPTTPTGQAVFTWLLETTRTHNAAEKAEGASFAESAFVIQEQTSTVEKITTSIPATDEQLADVPFVAGYLSGRLEFGLRQRLDLQVMVGDGAGNNLRGILNVVGIQTQALGADPLFDTALKALTKIRVTGRANPNAFVFHPNDWEPLILTRTADGIYIMGSPTDATAPRLWGLRVVVADVITENTGLAADFSFCLLAERQGVEIKTGFVNDDFTKGRITMRGTLRAAFPVLRATAFCTLTGI